MNAQPSILPGVPRVARYMSFSLRPGAESAASMELVQSLVIDDRMVVGIGAPLVAHWGGVVPELRTFPALSGPGVQMPSEQHALWLWLRGDDQGELVNRSNSIADSLADGFHLQQVVDGFKHGNDELGLDLTGYEDGTENPTGDDAVAATIATNGSSFVAVQQWVHDLRSFGALPQTEQDHIIGRRKSDNQEIADAPESAHVKRTEQESFHSAGNRIATLDAVCANLRRGINVRCFRQNARCLRSSAQENGRARGRNNRCTLSFLTPH